MTKEIPTIQLDDYRGGDAGRRAAMVDTLGRGLVELGFLNVADHGIEGELVSRVYDRWRELFELPDEVKRRYRVGEGGERGYTPFGVEHAKGRTQADLKEFWHVGQVPPDGHPLASVYPENVWPEEVDAIREPTLELYRRLEATAMVILEALADYFDLPKSTFSSLAEHGNSILRVIRYPPVPEDVEPGAVRAAEHEDINLITLLPEATDSGLEILTREGEWMPVVSGPGQIVVDAGDMLSRVTNEVVPATTHRVVNPQGPSARRERYSMPFFVHCYPDADLTVMDRFVRDGRPAKYPPITAGELLHQRLREIGLK